MPLGNRRNGRQSPKSIPKRCFVPHPLACSWVVAARNVPVSSTGKTHSRAAPWLHESQHPGSHKELVLRNQLVNLLKQW